MHTDIHTCLDTRAYVRTCIAWIKKFARMAIGGGVIHNSDVTQQSVVNKACVFAGSKHKNVYVMQYLMCTVENQTSFVCGIFLVVYDFMFHLNVM